MGGRKRAAVRTAQDELEEIISRQERLYVPDFIRSISPDYTPPSSEPASRSPRRIPEWTDSELTPPRVSTPDFIDTITFGRKPK